MILSLVMGEPKIENISKFANIQFLVIKDKLWKYYAYLSIQVCFLYIF